MEILGDACPERKNLFLPTDDPFTTQTKLADGNRDAARILHEIHARDIAEWILVLLALAPIGICGTALVKMFEEDAGGDMDTFIRKAKALNVV